MALLTLQQLLTPLTQQQCRANFVTQLQALGVPAQNWRQGGALSTMLTVVSAVYSTFTQLVVAAIGGGFLAYAVGPWLDLLALNVYNVLRIPATFATGSLTLTNTAGGIYSFLAGQFFALNPTTNQQYVNTAPFTLGAGSPSSPTSVNVTFAAVNAGSQGSANVNTITSLVTAVIGVAATNPASFVGVDAQSDAALRQACTNKLGSLGIRGVRSAYAWAISIATNAVTNAPVNINRSTVSVSSHTGQVQVYVASPSGAPDPNDVAGVVTSIEDNAQPQAITVTVTAATAVVYNPTLTVWAQASANVPASTIQADVATALTALIATFPIGGLTRTSPLFTGLSKTLIEGTAAAAHPAIYDVEGATDLALLPNQVATDSIIVNVNLV